MNDDGNVTVPHEPKTDEAPENTPVFSPKQTDSPNEPELDYTSPNGDMSISHDDSPDDDSTESDTTDTEPVDIFDADSEDTTSEPEAEAETEPEPEPEPESEPTPKPEPTPTPASTPAPTPTMPAQAPTQINNNPFNNRNRFQQVPAQQPNTNVPQFFNDAILANTPVAQPRKSKKGLFIGIGVGAVAIILLIVLLSQFLGPKVVTTANGKQLNTNSKPLFYRYANKLLNGTDSDAAISGDYDIDKEYAYMSKVVIDSYYNDSSSYDKNYLNELSASFSQFKEQFFKDNEKIDNNFAKNGILDYEELLEFFKSDPRELIESNEVLLDSYLSGGLSATSNKANKLLNNTISNSYYATIHEIKKDSIESYVKVIEAYNKSNCAKDGKLIYKCANKAPIGGKDKKSYSQIAKEKNSEVISLVDNDYLQLGAKCWEIMKMLEGKK